MAVTADYRERRLDDGESSPLVGNESADIIGGEDFSRSRCLLTPFQAGDGHDKAPESVKHRQWTMKSAPQYGGPPRCAPSGCQIGDSKVVAADPTAAGLAIEEPGAIRPAKPRSQGRDPSIVRGHLDGSDPRNEYGTGVVVICSPIEVGFNSQNGVADLPVVPELASPDEYAVAISVVEVHAEEGVAHVTISPTPPMLPPR